MIDIHFDYSKVPGSTELHDKFKKEFIIACSRAYPELVVIPYDVGFFRAWSNPDIPVRCGQKGVLDIIVFGNGWYLNLDTKTGGARLEPQQKAFKERIYEANNGFDRAYKINSIGEGMELIENEKRKEIR